MKPKITLLTTCYNKGRYFEDFMRGINSQTLPPSELVIVDDCSTDNSINNIQNYFKNNKPSFPVQILQNTRNMGPSASRNRGIDQTVGNSTLYFHCDMDDIYKPDKIKKSVNVFAKYPHVMAVYSDYDTFYDGKQNDSQREFKVPFSYKKLLQENIVNHNSAVVAEVYRQFGGYDERLRAAEDYDFWLMIGRQGLIYHIPESLFWYRRGETDSDHTISKEQWMKNYHILRNKHNGRSFV